MAIGVQDLMQKLTEFLSAIDPTDQAAFSGKISEFYQYALENYEQLDEDARNRIDKISEIFRQQAKQVVEAMPEGPDRRQKARQLAIAEGVHFRAENLLAVLESPTQHQEQILPAARAIGMQLIQCIVDVLFDVTRHTHKGPARFATIGLFYWAVDEILVAIHLTQRAFTNQAYSHIRTVFEILDKIELFHVQPQWAQLWISEDERKVWNELRPSEVRKKLGEPKFDPIYSFFSELGSHGTFKGLQARGAKRSQSEETSKRNFTLWVGGCPMEHHIVWSNTFCVYAALITLTKCIKVFKNYLNAEEMVGILDSQGEIVAKFLREYYVAWAEQEGLEAQPLIAFLEKQPWKSPPNING